MWEETLNTLTTLMLLDDNARKIIQMQGSTLSLRLANKTRLNSKDLAKQINLLNELREKKNF